MPPVTALRSPPLSRMTGALSPVMALSSTEAAPSITSPSAGMNSPASTSTTSPRASSEDETCSRARVAVGVRQPGGHDVPARLAQGVGLGLASALGHRLGEVGEDHREPQQQRDGQDEARRRLAVPGHRLDEQHQGEERAHPHHEHHRVAHLRPAGRASGTSRAGRPSAASRHGRRTPQPAASLPLGG